MQPQLFFDSVFSAMPIPLHTKASCSTMTMIHTLLLWAVEGCALKDILFTGGHLASHL